jgi:hypothetical protein
MLYDFFADSHPDVRLWHYLPTLMANYSDCIEKPSGFDTIAHEVCF